MHSTIQSESPGYEMVIYIEQYAIPVELELV